MKLTCKYLNLTWIVLVSHFNTPRYGCAALFSTLCYFHLMIFPQLMKITLASPFRIIVISTISVFAQSYNNVLITPDEIE